MYGFRINGTYANTNRRTQKARVQLVNDITMLHHQNDQAKKNPKWFHSLADSVLWVNISFFLLLFLVPHSETLLPVLLVLFESRMPGADGCNAEFGEAQRAP